MVECCAEVVAVERGDLSLVPPRVAGAHCEGAVHELEEVVEMPAVDVVGLTRRLELRERVFADRLEHAEARFPRGRGSGSDQAGIQECLEGRRHVEVVPGDRLDSVERDSSNEGSQHPEDLLRIRIQQVVAPVDRRAERALALREIRRAAREQGEGLAEALRRSFGPQDTDAGCCQLDRERETVESAADARDRVAVLADELEGRERGAGAFAVEADRGDVSERSRVRGTAGCGCGGWGGGERGILPEDCLLELSQLGGRVDAELFDESAARFLVGGECIRLPARPIERKHQLTA